MVILILILVFVLGALGWIIYSYNRLAQLRNALETEWADVDALLKKRADLIPNLVEVTKGYAKHEKGTLEAVARARSTMSSGEDRGKSEGELSGFVASMLALREQYPDLRANEEFRNLQAELFVIEKEIAQKRSNYNDVIKAYNDFVLKFPGSFVAAVTGFSVATPFEFLGSTEAPVVNLDLTGS